VLVKLKLCAVRALVFGYEPKLGEAVALLNTSVDVPALKVRPVFSENTTGEVLLRLTVLEPKLMVLVLLLFESSAVAVMLKLLVVSVPRVRVTAPLEVSASPSVTAGNIALVPIVTGPIVLPAVISVAGLEEMLKEIVPEWVYPIPDTSVTLPAT
jgi:hypothetical protein